MEELNFKVLEVKLKQEQGSGKNQLRDGGSVKSQGLDPKKLENALNDWLQKVEVQINSVEDRVFSCVQQTDLEAIERRLSQLVKTQLREANDSSNSKVGYALRTSYNNEQHSRTESTENERRNRNPSEIKTLEQRFNRKLTESVDQLGDLIKNFAKQQQKLTSRIVALERDETRKKSAAKNTSKNSNLNQSIHSQQK